MKKKHLRLVAITAASISIFGLSFLAVGRGSDDNNEKQNDLSTPITYQGQLSWDGEPVEGVVNLEFRLFNAPVDGEQVGPTLFADELVLTNGLFSIELDFDNTITSDNSTWLEITVDGTTLNPREHLASAHVNHQPSISDQGLTGQRGEAGQKGKPGVQGEAGFLGPSGSAGLHVPPGSLGTKGERGSIGPIGPQGIQGPPGPPGKDGEDDEDGDPLAGCGCWNLNGSKIYYNSGYVGIGKSNPKHKLHVQTNQGSRALFAYHTDTSGTRYGVYSQSKSTSGRGVFGYASSSSSPTLTTFGVYGRANAPKGRGIYGYAANTAGTNYGVYGRTLSPDGYAGYFQGGRNYFEGNVGIGTNNPQEKLHIAGESGVDGIMFPDGTVQTTAGGGGGNYTNVIGSKTINSTDDNGPTTTLSVNPNSIATSHIIPNIVSSIDGVSNDGGDIDFIAGTNMTITPNDAGNSITFAVSGSGGPVIEFAETGASFILTTSWQTILPVTIILPGSGKVHVIANASVNNGSNTGSPALLGISLTPNGTPTHIVARVDHYDPDVGATLAASTQYVAAMGPGTQTFYLVAKRLTDPGGTISVSRSQISVTFFPN